MEYNFFTKKCQRGILLQLLYDKHVKLCVALCV